MERPSLHGLLDLPGSWLRGMIRKHLDDDTRRAVMRASQRCCGLALGAASSCGLSLQVGQAPTPVQRTVRHMVLQHAPRIKLRPQSADPTLDLFLAASAQTMEGLDAVAAEWRQRVWEVEVEVRRMEGLPQPTRLLAWLAAAFPHARGVSVTFRTLHPGETFDDEEEEPDTLPGIAGDDDTSGGGGGGGGGVTAPQGPPGHAGVLVAPHLQQLHVWGVYAFLGDAVFERLLQLPALTHLELTRLELQRSHAASVPASGRWQELVLELASVATLARLPLRGVEELHVTEVHCTSDAHAALSAAAAANMRHCRCIAAWSWACLSDLVLAWDEDEHLSALLPLVACFPNAASVALGTRPITPATIAVLRRGGLPPHVTSLGVRWNGSRGDWRKLEGGAHRLLLPALAAAAPSVRNVFVGVMGEQQLAQLCLTATADVHVKANTYRGVPGMAEWTAEQVEAALQEAGNRHVTLTVVPGFGC